MVVCIVWWLWGFMMRHPCCASDLRAVAWFAVLTTLLIAATSDHFSVGPRGTIVSTPDAESKTPARMASVGDETDPTSFFGSAAFLALTFLSQQ